MSKWEIFWTIAVFTSPFWIYIYARIISSACIRSWMQIVKSKIRGKENEERQEK